jgi:hypothetical protein
VNRPIYRLLSSAGRLPSDQEQVAPTSGRAVDRPVGSSPRSLRSAVLAVCLTGVVSIGIPFGLLMGKGGLVAAGLNRPQPIPAPQLAGCPGGPPVRNRSPHTGQCIQITGSGFRGGELIEITEASRPGWHSYLQTDDLGRFSWRYLIAANARTGPDVLTFVGTHQAEAALVPATAFCPFTVVPA